MVYCVFQAMTSLPFASSHSPVVSPLLIFIDKCHMILVLTLCSRLFESLNVAKVIKIGQKYEILCLILQWIEYVYNYCFELSRLAHHLIFYNSIYVV